MLIQLGTACVLGVVGTQALTFLLLGVLMLLDKTPSERNTARLIRFVYTIVFALAFVASTALIFSGESRLELPLGEWVELPGEYHFHFVLLLDALSIPFLLLATMLCGVVAVFSEKYLHKEPGYHRFFLLLCLFGFGDSLTVLSGSIEVLYASWEFLGLTSALLIAFFHERTGPVQNGLYTFIVYRISDLGLVTAAVVLYNQFFTGDFDTFLGQGPWPGGHTPLSQAGATAVGLLILVAALGKAAQVPFSGWLPRAMEGPTPSTAIFYGALSVHAGAFLLLRCSTILDASPVISWLVFGLGLATALMARFVGKVQTDIKCSLAYASLGQVGLIFAEIGLGLRILPVVHAVGHAVLRSVQFLRAPSLLHEIHEMHSALGHGHHAPLHPPDSRWSYRAALDRGFLENILERWFILPFLAFCRGLQRLDRMILDLIGGPEVEERRSS